MYQNISNMGENTHYTINDIFYIIINYIKPLSKNTFFLTFEEFTKIKNDILTKFLQNVDNINTLNSTNEYLNFKLGNDISFDCLNQLENQQIITSSLNFYIIPLLYSTQFYLLVLALFVIILFYKLYTSYSSFYFSLQNSKKSIDTFIQLIYGARMFILTKSKTFVFPVRINVNVAMMTHLYILLFLNNVVGLIPYNNNLTSQFVNVWLLALIIIVYLVVQIVKTQGFNYLKRYPKIDNYWYTSIYPFVMGLISHVFRMFSLSMRVFINMFAGHLLLGIFEHYIPILII